MTEFFAKEKEETRTPDYKAFFILLALFSSPWFLLWYIWYAVN